MYNSIGKVATSVSKNQGYTVVTYHATPVVKFNQEKIILNTGGWNTATTVRRMNQTSDVYGLGFRVLRRRGEVLCEEHGRLVPIDPTLTLRRA